MTYRFLFDECLSEELIAVANAFGYEGTHCNRRKLSGLPDPDVIRYCVANDFVAVTNNAGDFRRIYGRIDLHPGLVIIIPNAPIPVQRQLFTAVLAHLENQRDLVNRALEIDGEGTIRIYDWPPE